MREGKERAREIEEWLLKKAPPKKVFPVPPVAARLISEVVNGKC
ncbi:hypothetical protein [Thermococcus sp. JCM 11816]